MRRLAGLAIAALLATACSKSDSASATNGANNGTGGASAGTGGTSSAGQAGSTAGGATSGGAGGSTGGTTATGGSGGTSTGGSGGAVGGSGGAPVASPPCTLSLSKVVPLPKPSVMKPRAFGPAVVATPTGFIVAVHEAAEDGTEDVLSLIPVAFDGTVGATSTAKLSACFGNYAATGIGMTIRGGAGIATVGRPACKDPDGDTGGSLSLVAFGMGGDVQDIFLLKGPKGFAELTIPSHRSVAPVPGSSLWKISYLQGTTSYSFDASGITPKSAFNVLAEKTLRIASAASQNLLVQAAELDAGIVVSATGAMTAPKTFMLSKGSGISTCSYPSGVVVGSRITASTVRLDTIDDSANLVAQAQIPTPPVGVFDIAPVTKAIAIAVGDAKRVSMLVSTVPEVDFAPGVTSTIDVDATNPLVSSFDGKAIAAAGGSGRVAAVWLRGSTPDAASPLGGVALFECK